MQQVSREQDVVLHCTLVTPLKNERDNVEQLWNAIQGQTVKPDEWIITDNGSTDGTYEWLLEHAPRSPSPVLVLSLPGYTIAKMMNTAISSAQYDIIACCHGGTRIPQDWLENLLKPFIEDPTVDVSAGVWEPYGKTPFERWVASTMHVDIEKLDERTYLPATRSMAFKRSTWERVGGFPEWLPKFGEDTLFAIRLHSAGCKFVIARGAKVGWRPKSSLSALLKQEYLYGEANGLIGLKRKLAGLVRIPVTLVSAIVLGIATKDVATAWVALIAMIAAHIMYIAVSNNSGKLGVPIFRGYFFRYWLLHAAYDVGYLRGIVLRWLGKVLVPIQDVQAVRMYSSRLERGQSLV